MLFGTVRRGAGDTHTTIGSNALLVNKLIVRDNAAAAVRCSTVSIVARQMRTNDTLAISDISNKWAGNVHAFIFQNNLRRTGREETMYVIFRALGIKRGSNAV